MPDPVPPPLPPMPYPGYFTEEQRAKLAALAKAYWDYLMSIRYTPPNPVPPYPTPPAPPPNPGPIAGGDTLVAGQAGDTMFAAPEAAGCGRQVWTKTVTETNTIWRKLP